MILSLLLVLSLILPMGVSARAEDSAPEKAEESVAAQTEESVAAKTEDSVSGQTEDNTSQETGQSDTVQKTDESAAAQKVESTSESAGKKDSATEPDTGKTTSSSEGGVKATASLPAEKAESSGVAETDTSDSAKSGMNDQSAAAAQNTETSTTDTSKGDTTAAAADTSAASTAGTVKKSVSLKAAATLLGAAGDTEIETVSLTVPALHENDQIAPSEYTDSVYVAPNVTPAEDANCSVIESNWSRDTSGAELPYSIYVYADKTYYISMTLQADEGYCFSDSTEISVSCSESVEPAPKVISKTIVEDSDDHKMKVIASVDYIRKTIDPIEKVSIDVTAPEAGTLVENIRSSRSGVVSIPSGEGYEFVEENATIKALSWYYNGTRMSDSDQIQKNRTYTLYVSLRSTNSSEMDKDFTDETEVEVTGGGTFASRSIGSSSGHTTMSVTINVRIPGDGEGTVSTEASDLGYVNASTVENGIETPVIEGKTGAGKSAVVKDGDTIRCTYTPAESTTLINKDKTGIRYTKDGEEVFEAIAVSDDNYFEFEFTKDKYGDTVTIVTEDVFEKTYEAEADTAENGSLSIGDTEGTGSARLTEGETAEIFVKPDDDYLADEVTVTGSASGDDISVTRSEAGDDGSWLCYTFTMPAEDVKVAATFRSGKPVPEWEGKTVVWDAVDGADSYKYEYWYATLPGDASAHSTDTTEKTEIDFSDYINETVEEKKESLYFYCSVTAVFGETDITAAYVYAKFHRVEIEPATLYLGNKSATADDPTGGTASGDSFGEADENGVIVGIFADGEEMEADLTPNEGYAYKTRYPSSIGTMEDNTLTWSVSDSISITAVFEELAVPITVTLEMGEGHETLAQSVFDAYIEAYKDQEHIDVGEASVDGTTLSLIFFNVDDEEKKITVRDVQDILQGLIGGELDENGSDNGEQYIFVGQQTQDNYKSREEVYDEYYDADEVFPEDGQQFYALWMQMIEKIEATIDAPVCGTEVSAEESEYSTEDDPSYEIYTQTNRPVVTITSEHCKLVSAQVPDSEEMMEIAFWEEEPKSFKSFIGTIKGGEKYNAIMFIQADFGYYIDFEETTAVINDEKTEFARFFGMPMISFAVEAEHDWDDGEVTTEPTCVKEGVKTYTCQAEDCEETKTEQIEIDPDAHDWGEWTVTKEATATETGEKTRVCKNDASHKETEEIPATGEEEEEEEQQEEEQQEEETQEEEQQEEEQQEEETQEEETQEEEQSEEIEYKVTYGVNGTWTKGSAGGYYFTINRDEDDDTTFSHFVSIEVDGNVLDTGKYTAVKGSLKGMLKKFYMETLSVGTHKLKVNFDDGSAETTFIVKAAAKKSSSAATRKTSTGTNAVSRSGRAAKTGDTGGVFIWAMIFGAAAAAMAAAFVSMRRKKRG